MILNPAQVSHSSAVHLLREENATELSGVLRLATRLRGLGPGMGTSS